MEIRAAEYGQVQIEISNIQATSLENIKENMQYMCDFTECKSTYILYRARKYTW